MFNTSVTQFLFASAVAMCCATAANAQAVNECNASAKLVKSERAVAGSPNWRFTFQVTTSCDASSGSFEYEYRVKGTAGAGTPRTAPSWNAANGRSFSWTDEVSIGAAQDAEFARFVPGTFKSKKIR